LDRHFAKARSRDEVIGRKEGCIYGHVYA
jgi:hypothetical protein